MNDCVIECNANVAYDEDQMYSPIYDQPQIFKQRQDKEQVTNKVRDKKCRTEGLVVLYTVTLITVVISFLLALSATVYSQTQLSMYRTQLQAIMTNIYDLTENGTMLRADTETLTQILNTTDPLATIQMAATVSMGTVSEPQTKLNIATEQSTVPPIGSSQNPASSCKDITQGMPSAEYWIQANNDSPLVQVYCDMNRTSCSCNTTGGWMRVANLDMTDPNQNCPDGFRLVTRTEPPLRLCRRPNNFRGCVSTIFQTHEVEYSQVCGRIIGYQYGSPNAFRQYASNTSQDLNSAYVDGVSLTYGQLLRQHIWTFAAALHEEISNTHVCPCTQSDEVFTGTVPPFIRQDYFCATASREYSERILYPDDPLWDGQGCGETNTCCQFNNPPWFCKQLPQPTTDDIELRLCGDQGVSDEDTPLEDVEIYVC